MEPGFCPKSTIVSWLLLPCLCILSLPWSANIWTCPLEQRKVQEARNTERLLCPGILQGPAQFQSELPSACRLHPLGPAFSLMSWVTLDNFPFSFEFCFTFLSFWWEDGAQWPVNFLGPQWFCDIKCLTYCEECQRWGKTDSKYHSAPSTALEMEFWSLRRHSRPFLWVVFKYVIKGGMSNDGIAGKEQRE